MTLSDPPIDFSRRLIFVKKLLTVKVSNFSALHEERENFRQGDCCELTNLRNTFHMKRLSPYFPSYQGARDFPIKDGMDFAS